MPKRNTYKQKGGSSDFMHSFYANTAVGGPAAISQATLAGIDNAPMFNPLSESSTIPGMATGIVPSGLYLASVQSGGCGCGGGKKQQLGGGCGKKHQKGGGCGCGGGQQSGGGCGKNHQKGGQPLEALSTEQLRDACNANGISCRGQNGGYKHRDTMIKQLGGVLRTY